MNYYIFRTENNVYELWLAVGITNGVSVWVPHDCINSLPHFQATNMKPIIAVRPFECCQSYDWKVCMYLCHSNHNLVSTHRGLVGVGLPFSSSTWPVPSGVSVAAPFGDRRGPIWGSQCQYYRQAFKNVCLIWDHQLLWRTSARWEGRAKSPTVSDPSQMPWRKQITKEARASSAFYGNAIFLFLFSTLKRQLGLSHNINVAQQDKLDWWA